MIEHVFRYIGQRTSIRDTIYLDGVPADLTGATNLRFKARPALSSTLEIDSAATIESASGGVVRFDPAAGDVDTEGFYAAWWSWTDASAKPHETPEFLFEVREHDAVGDASAIEYISVPELKETLSLSGTTFSDADIADAVLAASRDIDERTGQSFYLGAPGEVRYYTPVSEEYVLIDAASAITAVSANGTALVPDTNYVRTGTPIEVLRSLNGFAFPRGIQNGVAVTGTFGYSSVPAQVKQAAKILAARFLKRSREATFAVVGFALDGGAVRMPGSDPDVDSLLAPFTRSQMIE